MVTDSCTSVKLATGVWDHIQSQHNITDMTSCLGKEGSVDQVDIMQGDPTTSQQLTSTLASAGVAAMLKQHVEDGCTQLPTTFRPSCSKAHSAWSHDGTDFTTGHAQQVAYSHLDLYTVMISINLPCDKYGCISTNVQNVTCCMTM